MKASPFSWFFFIAILVACKSKVQERSRPSDIIPVQTMELQKADVKPVFHISGQFTTEDESNLSFKNGGIIRNIYVKEGEAVRKGQILAVLDMTEINALTNQAEIRVAKAERDYERARNLYHDSVATMEQMQNAKTALEIARQQAVNAKFNKETSVIRATQSGFVLNKFAQEGQIVGPGMPVLRINGAAQDKWVLKAGVSDRQWAAIRTGDKAMVSSDAFPDEKMAATVTSRSEATDPMTGTFTITITLAGKAMPGVASGLFGKAEVQGSNPQSGWKIPFSALLDSDRDKGFVFVAGSDGMAHKVQVSIDRIENKDVLISDGLEDFDNIIIKGSAYLTDGSKISIDPSN